MILNNYETIYILKPQTNEETNIKLVNQCKNIIQSYGGKNIFVQHKSRRHLSFNIKKNYDGIYIQINYEGNGNIVKAIEKAMRLNDDIIRYLTIKHKKNYIEEMHI